MENRSRGLFRRLVLPIMALLGGEPCIAANGSWNVDASGDWAAGANWVSGIIADGPGATASFANNPAATRTVSLNTARTIGALTFADTNIATAADWVIGGTGSLILSMPTGTPAIAVGSLATGQVAQIEVPVSGTALVKTGAGTLSLAAASTVGAITILQGVLEIRGNATLGAGIITANAQLGFNRTSDLTVGNTIGGSGLLRLFNSGKLTLSGANTYSGGTQVGGGGDRFVSVANHSALGSGPVRLGDTAGSSQVWFHSALDQILPNQFEIRTARWIIDSNTVNGNPAGMLTVNGNVYLNQAGVADIYCNQNLTLAGGVTSTGGLTKMGGGTLRLSGAASYNGDTLVNAGTLVMDCPLTTVGTTKVQSGATLTGSGTITGPVTVYSGGKLLAGKDGTGATATGKLSLGSTGRLDFSLGAPGATGNTRVAVTGQLNLTNGGVVAIVSKTGFSAGLYTLITYTGSLTGSFSSVSLPPGFFGTLVYSSGQVKLQVLESTLVGPADKTLLSYQPSVTLDWAAPPGAVSFEVYLGTTQSAVTSATAATPGLFKGRTTTDAYPATGLAAGVSYWRIDYIYQDGTVIKGPTWSFEMVDDRDLMADTWVATDALDRALPDHALAGPPRDGRPTAIFYFLWHTKNSLGNDGPRDMTLEISRLGGYTDRRNPWADNPKWMEGGNARSWYWSEPEAGYYSSDDEWVIRRHIAWLVAAGVDILAFDNTNGNPQIYQTAWVKIAETVRKMRREGMRIDLKFLFYTHADSPATVTWLYENLYRPGLYPEMWLQWGGKPAIVAYPNGIGAGETPLSGEVRNFFTLRSGWANVGDSPSNEWQWIDSTTPQDWGWTTRQDIPEQVPVAAGGWANSNLGRSYFNRAQPIYDKDHLAAARTEGLGKFFSEQFHYGLKLDPQLLFITGWNEWWAGAWTADTYHPGYNVLDNPCAIGQRYFVDAYTAEYSRDIEPMKGSYGDNYYYQMVAANRLRKGVRPVPNASLALTAAPTDFSGVGPAYADPPDDTFARNASTTFSNLANYTNTSGRNDFRTLKVARDGTYLYFYAETKDPVTAASGTNWMNLFVDTDCSRGTGWEGYDYVINFGGSGQVRRFTNNTWAPTSAGSATVSVTGNTVVIRVSRATLGLGADPLKFDFKWADNFQTAGDISSFATSGDSAPDRRFNYRYQSAPEATLVARQDGFENGQQSSWGETFNAGSQWQISATTPYTGAKCLLGTGKASPTDASGTLINRTSTAGMSSLRVAFRYKLTNVQDAQDIQIYYRNTSGAWIAMGELGRDSFHAAGQAWGYDERQNVWIYYADARRNSGADAAFFHADFAIHIQIKNLTLSSQSVSIDDFQISGTRPIVGPGMVNTPSPANLATVVPVTSGLAWSPGSGADTQTIYFGTPGNLKPLASLAASASTQAVPGPLAFATTYAWRVDTANAAGITPGPSWSFTTATPPNSPPALGVIGDRAVVAGQTISFTASASDPDLPLTFTLQSTPFGATIDPASGVFLWRPIQSQAPATVVIEIQVTDSGNPPLSARRSFTVQVAKPTVPRMDSFARDVDGTFRFRVTGDDGPDYRVWTSENLRDWEYSRTIEQPVSPFWFDDQDAKFHPQRFYKLEPGP
jgi:autotransporter-associated beta strand protein